ncbi:MAG: HAD-IA family hydrolase [Draconibacterium sp.]|nr:HAD-IA family hydrolase [Draconibacterium sp.]
MQTDLTNIKNIIFDLGNVLLNLDFDASINAFQKLGLTSNLIDQKLSYSDPVFYNLETGKITPEEFRKRVHTILNNTNVTDQQIDTAWSAMILDIPEHRVKKLQDLRKRYNIYLFSNTNKIHIDGLLEDFKAQHGIDFTTLFTEIYYSHEINDRKPNLSSFEKVILLSGVKPEESIFIDDLEDNITAAKQAGLKTFWLKKGMEMIDIF